MVDDSMFDDERRNFQRVTFEANTQIDANGVSLDGELLDISLRGALLRFEADVPKAKAYKLRIYLPSTEITLTFDVELSHSKDGFYGFKFLGGDIDSISHLRRLLELNSGDDEGIEREISYWLGS